jgi:hypothetical protein
MMDLPEAPIGRKVSGGLLVVFCALAMTGTAPAAPWPAPEFQRGVVYSSWDGSYPHQRAWTAHLDHFEALGVTWIQILTFAHQPQVEGPRIVPTDARRWPTAFVKAARARGFRILVKPHVWSREFYDGSKRWRGSIKMGDEARWRSWFENYERFIVAEAKLAATAGAEMFSVGLEYVEATRGRGRAWRRVISRVRAVFPGTLTYSADGNHELAHIDFWDALDVIGVNAYFDVGEPRWPGHLGLVAGWAPHLARIGRIARRFDRPVVFTEAGYPSVEGATRRPWQWPSREQVPAPALQGAAYDALLLAATEVPWFAGVFWWKYYERPENTSHAHDYTPRGKPAEAVIRKWYRGTGTLPKGAADSRIPSTEASPER